MTETPPPSKQGTRLTRLGWQHVAPEAPLPAIRIVRRSIR
jgi:hypothetical protein